MRKKILGLSLAAATVVLIGTALATPIIGTIVADTARGGLTEPLNFNRKFDSSGRTSVKLKTRGAIEIVTQRIEVAPESSFGWHSHPGDTIVVVKQGTLTLYHDDHCTVGTDYGPGTAFPNRLEEVHLARNNSPTETLVVFATYFFPKTTPPVPVRIDKPSPGPNCPQ
jgi:quercetin dioxygenase-like cupin family protein